MWGEALAEDAGPLHGGDRQGVGVLTKAGLAKNCLGGSKGVGDKGGEVDGGYRYTNPSGSLYYNTGNGHGFYNSGSSGTKTSNGQPYTTHQFARGSKGVGGGGGELEDLGARLQSLEGVADGARNLEHDGDLGNWRL